jgi:hypothetical protein
MEEILGYEEKDANEIKKPMRSMTSSTTGQSISIPITIKSAL